MHGIFGSGLGQISLNTLGIELNYTNTVGLRAKIETLTNGSVMVSAYIDINNNGIWRFITSYVDTDENTDGLDPLAPSEVTVFNNCATLGDKITSSTANMYKPWLSAGNTCWIRVNAEPQTSAVTKIVIKNSKITSP